MGRMLSTYCRSIVGRSLAHDGRSRIGFSAERRFHALNGLCTRGANIDVLRALPLVNRSWVLVIRERQMAPDFSLAKSRAQQRISVSCRLSQAW